MGAQDFGNVLTVMPNGIKKTCIEFVHLLEDSLQLFIASANSITCTFCTVYHCRRVLLRPLCVLISWRAVTLSTIGSYVGPESRPPLWLVPVFLAYCTFSQLCNEVRCKLFSSCAVCFAGDRGHGSVYVGALCLYVNTEHHVCVQVHATLAGCRLCAAVLCICACLSILYAGLCMSLCVHTHVCTCVFWA